MPNTAAVIDLWAPQDVNAGSFRPLRECLELTRCLERQQVVMTEYNSILSARNCLFAAGLKRWLGPWRPMLTARMGASLTKVVSLAGPVPWKSEFRFPRQQALWNAPGGMTPLMRRWRCIE